jgi:hypothetical protein
MTKRMNESALQCWKKPSEKTKRVHRIKTSWEDEYTTYDCAFLEPLAFPPDLPPVILIDFRSDEDELG